jgi:hypothetical protein
MRKLKPDVELIHSDNQENAMLKKLAALVKRELAQKIPNPAEMTTEELTDEVLLQPWALPREIATAILRLLPVSHQEKNRYYYEDYGCLRCDTKLKPHQSLGMCAKCHARFHARSKAAIARDRCDRTIRHHGQRCVSGFVSLRYRGGLGTERTLVQQEPPASVSATVLGP